MFNIGFSELVLILLVALIFVGPKDLPKVGAYLGRSVRKFKQYIADFKEETGLDEMEKEYKKASADLKQTISDADPTKELLEIRKDLSQTEKEINAALKEGGSGAAADSSGAAENSNQ